MYIIPQFYKNVLKERIISKISSISSELVDIIINNLSSTADEKYLKLISEIQSKSIDMIKNIIVETFEEIDLQFKNSSSRKKYYMINKSNIPRTLITIFGEISFNRTYYKSKINDSYIFYLDELFNLPKYDHYDPIVKAIAIDKSFSTNQLQASKDIGEFISPISVIASADRNKFHIPRQTINNWINAWNAPNYICSECETPKTLYIMADEKYLGCQDLDNDIMSKCMISFEGIEKVSKNRNQLINRTVYSTYSQTPWEEFSAILSQKYDFNKIDNIILMGDGANWINSGRFELKMENNNKITRLLCIFHFKQAINRFTTNDSLRKELINKVNTSTLSEFKKYTKSLIIKDDKKQSYINYIINNYKAIKDALNNNIGSSMESHISHCIANLFASRPKGFSSKNIKKYLKINDYKNNDLNILQLYLKTYNDNEIRNINEEELNYSIFDKKDISIPLIDYGMLTYTKLNGIIS